MDYASFKDYLKEFLWKQNDTVLHDSLDSLIRMGTTELDRKLPIDRRENVLTFATVMNDTNAQDLPTDFKQMISLNSENYEYQGVTANQIFLELNANGTNRERPYYNVSYDKLIFGQTFLSTNTPINFVMMYRTKLPDYQATDTSWVEQEYLDLYTYTILKHTAPWLREVERVALWVQLAQEALTSVLEEDAFNIEYGGSPQHMNMPRSPTPRRGGRSLYTR